MDVTLTELVGGMIPRPKFEKYYSAVLQELVKTTTVVMVRPRMKRPRAGLWKMEQHVLVSTPPTRPGEKSCRRAGALLDTARKLIQITKPLPEMGLVQKDQVTTGKKGVSMLA